MDLFCNLRCLCLAVSSVPCNLVITCWERVVLFALLCVMFSCQVWYLIVSIPDICLVSYFVHNVL